MKIACPKGLQPALGQAIITGENREKPIDNICPPKSRWLKNKKKNFLSEREKVGEEKGVCGGVWECGDGGFAFQISLKIEIFITVKINH